MCFATPITEQQAPVSAAWRAPARNLPSQKQHRIGCQLRQCRQHQNNFGHSLGTVRSIDRGHLPEPDICTARRESEYSEPNPASWIASTQAELHRTNPVVEAG